MPSERYLFIQDLRVEQSMASIPRGSAKLCLNCDRIYDANECPRCGLSSFFPVSKVLQSISKEAS